MNPEIRDLWADRLESGEYEQGKEALCVVVSDRKQHCCLGVLTEEAIKAGVPVRVTTNGNLVLFDGSDGFLPESVKKWAGLKEGDPVLLELPDSEEVYATTANDSLKLTFPQIADLVRRL